MSGNVIERVVPGQMGGARVIALWDVCLWNTHYVETINTNAVKYAENSNVMFYPEAMLKNPCSKSAMKLSGPAQRVYITTPPFGLEIFFFLFTYTNKELPTKAENFAKETYGCLCVLSLSCIIQ